MFFALKTVTFLFYVRFPISAKPSWIRQICAGMALFTCSPVAPQLRIRVVSTNGVAVKSEWHFYAWSLARGPSTSSGEPRAGYIQQPDFAIIDVFHDAIFIGRCLSFKYPRRAASLHAELGLSVPRCSGFSPPPLRSVPNHFAKSPRSVPSLRLCAITNEAYQKISTHHS